MDPGVIWVPHWPLNGQGTEPGTQDVQNQGRRVFSAHLSPPCFFRFNLAQNSARIPLQKSKPALLSWKSSLKSAWKKDKKSMTWHDHDRCRGTRSGTSNAAASCTQTSQVDVRVISHCSSKDQEYKHLAHLFGTKRCKEMYNIWEKYAKVKPGAEAR